MALLARHISTETLKRFNKTENMMLFDNQFDFLNE